MRRSVNEYGSGGEAGVFGAVVGRESKGIGARETGVGIIGRCHAAESDCSICRLRYDSQGGICTGDRQLDRYRLSCLCLGVHIAYGRCGARIHAAAGGSIVACIAAHGGAAEKLDGPNVLDLERTFALGAGQHCAAGVQAVAGLALREAENAHGVVMVFNPGIADGVHAVGGGSGCVARVLGEQVCDGGARRRLDSGRSGVPRGRVSARQ